MDMHEPSRQESRRQHNRDHGEAAMQVLIVEDCQINRFFLEKVLKHCGYGVLTAYNGREALDKLAKHPVDLVLMDVQMPILDGLAATRLIRGSDTPAAKVPIVAVTALNGEVEYARCLEAGMDAVLHKPVQVEKLRRIVERLTGRDTVTLLQAESGL